MIISYVIFEIYSLVLLTIIAIAICAFAAFNFNKLFEKAVRDQKLIFLVIFLFVLTLLPAYFPTLGIYAKLIYIIMGSLWTYITMLALNIYFVSQKREEDIPLMQPARTIAIITFVLVVFLGSTIIFKILLFSGIPLLNLVIKTLYFISFFTILFANTEWLFFEYRVGEVHRNLMLIKRFTIQGIVILTQAAVVLMFFPFEAFGRAVFLAGISYVFGSYIQNNLSHRLKFRFLLESAAILGAIYLIIYFL